MSEKRKKFSGWSVLVGCFILMVFPGGMIGYTSGLYMYPICQELGFATSQYSICMTIAPCVNVLTSIFLVQYLSKGTKTSMKAIMLAGAVVLSCGFACMNFCVKLWQFYAMTAVWNLGYNLLTNIPVAMILSNWFVEKRALVTGIAFAGGNVGGAIFSTAISSIIKTQGWRYSYLFCGALCLVVTVLAILFLIKRSPAEYGQSPLGAGSGKAAAEDKPAEAWQGIDKKSALKTPVFYLICAAMLFTGIYAGGVTKHVTNYLCTSGWEIVAAGTVSTVFTLFGILGNTCGGTLISKAGIKKSVLIGGALVIAAMISLIYAATTKSAAYIYAACLGLAGFLGALAPAIIVSTTFGAKEYAGIFGLTNSFYLAGSALSAPVVAWVSEISSYKTAWIAVIVLVVLIIAIYFKSVDYGKKLREKTAV